MEFKKKEGKGKPDKVDVLPSKIRKRSSFMKDVW